MLSDLAGRAANTESLADLWLDLETFKLPPLATQINSVTSLSAGDVQRVAQRLFKDAATATIIVGDSKKLAPQFGEQVQVWKKDGPPMENRPQPAPMPAKKP
jgi:predicted Zn-dependent peptidase